MDTVCGVKEWHDVSIEVFLYYATLLSMFVFLGATSESGPDDLAAEFQFSRCRNGSLPAGKDADNIRAWFY